MSELRGLHVVVPAELLAGAYNRAEREGKTLSEAVASLLAGYADRVPPAARTPRNGPAKGATERPARPPKKKAGAREPTRADVI